MIKPLATADPAEMDVELKDLAEFVELVGIVGLECPTLIFEH